MSRPKGYKHSIETKRKIGLAHKGKQAPDGHMEKMTKAFIKKCSGSNHPSWKGGRRKSGKYIMILQHSHPFCDVSGYIMEHRLVMEKHLGRYLQKEELVHHIDGNPTNNDIKNLKLFISWSSHMKFHRNH